MRATAIVALALLAVPFSGCFDFGEAVDTFRLEFMLAGSGKWLDRSGSLLLKNETLTLPKTDPGPQGGGGVVRRLEYGVDNITILVRVSPEEKHDARLELGVRVMHSGGTDYEVRKGNLSDPLSFTGSGLGRYQIYATLGRGILKDQSPRRFYLDLEALWTIRSKVHPLWLPNQPTPTNYKDMADVFEVRAGGISYIDARTSFAGPWPSSSGTDVDLEIQTPSEQPLVCKGEGGGTNPQPDPIQASERGTASTYGFDGIWTIRVGALSARCPGGQPTYVNGASVPYQLLLSIRGSPPTKT